MALSLSLRLGMQPEANTFRLIDHLEIMERELNPPWLAQGFRTQAIGGFVVDERVSLKIQVHLTVQEQRDVRAMTGDVRVARG